MFRTLANVVNYDVKLYVQKGGELTTVLGFFAISLALFPFALGADSALLQQFAPALIWVVALLASLLTLPSIFHRDQLDGSLDQLRLSGMAVEWVAFAKTLANWIACQLPLIIISPLLALMLGAGEEQASRIAFSLIIGTPVLSAIGAIGSALTLNASNKGGVLAVLVLPLYIPVLIFGTALAMSDPSLSALDVPEFLLLLGIAMASLPLGCWAAALVINVQE